VTDATPRAITDEARLRAESAHIERLLDELRAMVSPPAWQRIEKLLQRVVALYGAGLAHLLEHACAAGAEPGALGRLAAADELLASLLVLHGLHPLTTEQRITRALQAVRAELELADHALVLVEISADGVVRLEASGALGGGAMSTRVAEGIVRRALEEAAPEVTAIELVGVPGARDRGPVQLRERHEAS
jgi:Fe-S cluster biogenesis protein NfuA